MTTLFQSDFQYTDVSNMNLTLNNDADGNSFNNTYAGDIRNIFSDNADVSYLDMFIDMSNMEAYTGSFDVSSFDVSATLDANAKFMDEKVDREKALTTNMSIENHFRNILENTKMESIHNSDIDILKDTNERAELHKDRKKRRVIINDYFNKKRTHQVEFFKKTCFLLALLIIVSMLYKFHIVHETVFIFIIGIGLALLAILFGYTTLDMFYRDSHNYDEYQATSLSKDSYLSDNRVFELGEKVLIVSGVINASQRKSVGYHDKATIERVDTGDGIYGVNMDDDDDGAVYDVQKKLIQSRNLKQTNIHDDNPSYRNSEDINVEEKCLNDEIVNYIYTKTKFDSRIIPDICENSLIVDTNCADVSCTTIAGNDITYYYNSVSGDDLRDLLSTFSDGQLSEFDVVVNDVNWPHSFDETSQYIIKSKYRKFANKTIEEYTNMNDQTFGSYMDGLSTDQILDLKWIIYDKDWPFKFNKTKQELFKKKFHSAIFSSRT